MGESGGGVAVAPAEAPASAASIPAPAASPAAPALPSSRAVYFVNPVVDMLVAGGGASLIAFLVLRYLGTGRTAEVIAVAAALQWVVNWPHFAATSFRLYQSYDRMMQFPKTAFLTPVLAVGGCALALSSPTGFAPWWLKFYLVWSSYHFAGQSKGVALLYSRRLGIMVTSGMRWLVVLACYGPYLSALLKTEAGGGWGEFWGTQLPRGLPFIELTLKPEAVMVGDVFLYASIGALFLFFVLAIRQNRAFPLAAVLPLVAQIIWFGPGLKVKGFAEFIPFFHSLQYLLVAWVFQLREQSAEPGYVPSLASVARGSAIWAVATFVGGWLLFQAFPLGLAQRGYPAGLAMGVVIATVSIHHFFVDGVIWKIRDARTRSMLQGNVFDLAGVPREVAA
jgi:hypothetical protein